MLLSQIKRNTLSKFALKKPGLWGISVLLPLAYDTAKPWSQNILLSGAENKETGRAFRVKTDKDNNSHGQQNGHHLGQVDGAKEFAERGR